MAGSGFTYGVSPHLRQVMRVFVGGGDPMTVEKPQSPLPIRVYCRKLEENRFSGEFQLERETLDQGPPRFLAGGPPQLSDTCQGPEN